MVLERGDIEVLETLGSTHTRVTIQKGPKVTAKKLTKRQWRQRKLGIDEFDYHRNCRAGVTDHVSSITSSKHVWRRYYGVDAYQVFFSIHTRPSACLD